MKLPHIPFYTGDWLKDPAVSICKPATRGIWFDLLCAMHECDRSGELTGTSEQLARLARCSIPELEAAFADLRISRAAEITSSHGIWVVANRRMKNEALTRAKRAKAGSLGGSQTQAKREQNPDTDNDSTEIGIKKVRDFAKEKGISQSDADWFYWKGRGNGWTNAGKPILDWQATLLSWHRGGYLPSQKQAAGAVGGRRGFAGDKPKERPAHSDFNKPVSREEPRRRDPEPEGPPVDVKGLVNEFFTNVNRPRKEEP